MEWIMINVRIGKETFYDVYRRKQSERAYEKRIAEGLVAPPAKLIETDTESPGETKSLLKSSIPPEDGQERSGTEG
uniref:Uncharacterized protein n=1 Tax=Knipowitschia caucasica TaxID=637954 RepID=A0AAV2LX11_KNICA